MNITFTPANGIGRYNVIHKGQVVGVVFSCLKHGQHSWKPVGMRQYFTTRMSAAVSLIMSAE